MELVGPLMIRRCLEGPVSKPGEAKVTQQKNYVFFLLLEYCIHPNGLSFYIFVQVLTVSKGNGS